MGSTRSVLGLGFDLSSEPFTRSALVKIQQKEMEGGIRTTTRSQRAHRGLGSAFSVC